MCTNFIKTNTSSIR